jgi:hypothetical protein
MHYGCLTHTTRLPQSFRSLGQLMRKNCLSKSVKVKALLYLSLSFLMIINVMSYSSVSYAETAKIPKSQWAFSNMLALRYNPLGLQDELFVGYKKKLYNKPEDNLLFGKSYWWAGLVTRASPQFAMGGLFFKTSPIAILELQGSFSRVQALTEASKMPSYYTDGTKAAVATTISPRSSDGNLITNGWQSSLQARLQGKVGPIALRITNLFRNFNLNTDGNLIGDDLFYDQTLDLVTPLQSWVYQNDTDLLYTTSENPWVLGARYTFARSLTEIEASDITPDDVYDIHRLGFLFAWKFAAPLTAEGLEAKKRHALIVLSQWHLDHAYRAGQSMNRAIPYFAVVYAFSGRLDSK